MTTGRRQAVHGNRHPKRRSRNTQRGLTLIEVIVTVFLLGLVSIGIAADVATTEHIATVSQTQSQIEVAMRTAADFVQDSSSKGLAYIPCANTTTKAYTLPGTLAGASITGVSESPTGGGTRNGTATTPLFTTAANGCAAGTADWGVQEIIVKVTLSGRSLSRTVWKTQRWCWKSSASAVC